MTGYEKLAAALSPAGTTEFAAVVCYPGIFIRDHYTELTREPWWMAHDSTPEVQAGLTEEQYTNIGIDWFSHGPGASTAEQRAICVVEKKGRYFRTDARTRRRERLYPPVVSGTLSVLSENAPVIDDLAAFLEERVRQWPPFKGLEAGRTDVWNLLVNSLGKRAMPYYSVNGSLWAVGNPLGCEQWLGYMATDPEPVFAAGQRILFNTVQCVKAAAASGCRAVWIEDCLTDMIGPARFVRYNLPLIRELVEAIRQAGLWSIYYFCGNPWPVMELLLETGADALALEEGKKGFRIDIDDVVARTQGRMTVLGNLDAIDLLAHGTREELRREITRQLDAGRRNGNRFIMSTGSPVTPDTPVARLREYVELVHELGTA